MGFIVVEWLQLSLQAHVALRQAHVASVVLRIARQPWGGGLDPPRAHTIDGPHEYVVGERCCA